MKYKVEPIEKLPNPYNDYRYRDYPSKGRRLEKLNEVIDKVNLIEQRFDTLLKLLQIELKD